MLSWKANWDTPRMAENEVEMITLLIVILHDLDHLSDLLEAWKSINVPGVTILQSIGGFQVEDYLIRSGLSGLLNLFDQEKPRQRTLMSLIDDEELLARAIAEADHVVKGFDRPHSGILFTVPVGQALGLQKWGQKSKEEPERRDKGQENLARWLEEDLKAASAGGKLPDFTGLKKKSILEVLDLHAEQLAVVQMDTPLEGVVDALKRYSGAPFACVVNREQRLMGIIHPQALIGTIMLPVIPDAFTSGVEDYEKVRKQLNGKPPQKAADLMEESHSLFLDESIEAALKKMKSLNFLGLPVVDRLYHVKGYISLVELLCACR